MIKITALDHLVLTVADMQKPLIFIRPFWVCKKSPLAIIAKRFCLAHRKSTSTKKVQKSYPMPKMPIVARQIYAS
nr:hypothetical protein [Mannheimia haemolytica]